MTLDVYHGRKTKAQQQQLQHFQGKQFFVIAILLSWVNRKEYFPLYTYSLRQNFDLYLSGLPEKLNDILIQIQNIPRVI